MGNELAIADTSGCYDHMAGRVAVSLHDRFRTLEWLAAGAMGDNSYDVTRDGAKELSALGIDVAAMRALRRRFA
jgi:hypothetical protein